MLWIQGVCKYFVSLHSINVLFINSSSADDFTAKYMRSLALVNNKGKVFWPPPTKFRSTCQVDVAYFPFDDQTCMLKLGSWLHDGFSVSNITWIIFSLAKLISEIKRKCTQNIMFHKEYMWIEIHFTMLDIYLSLYSRHG